MFCKHCGKQIADDSTFCQYCGGKQTVNDSSTREELVKTTQSLNVNGNISVSNNESLLNRIIQFVSTHVNISIAYAIWFLLNLVLLISGSDEKHFFPRIYKTQEWHSAGYGGFGHTEETWEIKWDIDYYGWTEFVIYVALLPLLIYVSFILYKKYQENKTEKNITNFNPSEGLRRD